MTYLCFLHLQYLHSNCIVTDKLYRAVPETKRQSCFSESVSKPGSDIWNITSPRRLHSVPPGFYDLAFPQIHANSRISRNCNCLLQQKKPQLWNFSIICDCFYLTQNHHNFNHFFFFKFPQQILSLLARNNHNKLSHDPGGTDCRCFCCYRALIK